MAYKIIRCGINCDLVIVMSPETATPESENAEFYRWASWSFGKQKAGQFHPVNRDTARGYFSGQADGLGWHDFPKEPFASLDDIEQFINGQRS